MSLENLWPQSFDKMGRTRGNQDKKDLPSEPGDHTQDGDQAELETADGLDPALAKAVSVMSTNIIKVIEEKLSPLAETIHKHATEIQTISKLLDEAEVRPLAVENSTAAQEPRIVELEKQVSALTESSDMAENCNRRLSIQVVGLAEDSEAEQAVEFFDDMATSRPKDDHKGRPHKAGEPNANLSRTRTGAPGWCCYDSTLSETKRGLQKLRAGQVRMVA